MSPQVIQHQPKRLLGLNLLRFYKLHQSIEARVALELCQQLLEEFSVFVPNHLKSILQNQGVVVFYLKLL